MLVPDRAPQSLRCDYRVWNTWQFAWWLFATHLKQSIFMVGLVSDQRHWAHCDNELCTSHQSIIVHHTDTVHHTFWPFTGILCSYSRMKLFKKLGQEVPQWLRYWTEKNHKIRNLHWALPLPCITHHQDYLNILHRFDKIIMGKIIIRLFRTCELSQCCQGSVSVFKWFAILDSALSLLKLLRKGNPAFATGL